jgi:hypothetical protein
MLFNVWYEFPIFIKGDWHVCRVLLVREIQMWTHDQVVFANRVTASLVILNAALVATALTIIYLAFQ